MSYTLYLAYVVSFSFSVGFDVNSSINSTFGFNDNSVHCHSLQSYSHNENNKNETF